MTAARRRREQSVPFFRSIQAKYALTYLLVVAAILIVINTSPILMAENMVFTSKQSSTAEENAHRMTEELANVKSGQVTYAVRDTLIDDKSIKQGDYMGIGDSGILSVGEDMEAVTKDMVAEMADEDSAIISIYYGEEVAEAAAQKLGAEIEEQYPDCEVEVHFGGQPIYYCRIKGAVPWIKHLLSEQ